MIESGVDSCCPAWRALAEDRDRSADGEARWRLGLEHAVGCSECRARVVAIDPLAVFALSAVPSDEAAGADVPEVEAMLQAVSAVRRHHGVPETSRSTWLSWAAVAALFLALALFAVPKGEEVKSVADLNSVAESEAVVEESSEPASLGPVTVGAALGDLDSDDPLDAIGHLAARTSSPRVYRWHDRDLSVVMIVDENLDV